MKICKKHQNLKLDALKMAAREVMPYSTHILHKYHIPDWKKDVGEKHKLTRHACLQWHTQKISERGANFRHNRVTSQIKFRVTTILGGSRGMPRENFAK